MEPDPTPLPVHHQEMGSATQLKEAEEEEVALSGSLSAPVLGAGGPAAAAPWGRPPRGPAAAAALGSKRQEQTAAEEKAGKATTPLPLPPAAGGARVEPRAASAPAAIAQAAADLEAGCAEGGTRGGSCQPGGGGGGCSETPEPPALRELAVLPGGAGEQASRGPVGRFLPAWPFCAPLVHLLCTPCACRLLLSPHR